VAQQSKKDLAEFFELISGSGALRGIYDKLAEEVRAAESKTGMLFSKQKLLKARKRLVKEAKDEAEKYQQEVADLVSVHCTAWIANTVDGYS
jgi:hypothetical protein